MIEANTAQVEASFDAAWDDVVAGKPQNNDLDKFSGLGSRLLTEFQEAERARRDVEERWLQDLRQYKGKYSPEVEAAIKDRSKAFKRITATKVDTLTALMLDLLFPNGKERNYTLEPSSRPQLPPFKMHELKEALRKALQGQVPPRDVIDQTIKQAAEDAARKHCDVIDDQLAETRYRHEAKAVLHSGHLYGDGVMKGPLATAETQVSYEWDEKRSRYREVVKTYTRPSFVQVPVWRFYPDMEATEIKNCRYVWEHHRLTKAAILSLAKTKGFDEQAMIDYVTANADGRADMRQYESEFREVSDKQSMPLQNAGLYDVFERYGWIDGRDLVAAGVEIPPERQHETFFANVWLLADGQVIRVQKLRAGIGYLYHLYQFREDETSIFADGIATVMRDDQDMSNAATRAALDNAAITAGSQLVVNTQDLAPNEDVSTFRPFRIWKQVKGDSQFSPVKAVDLPNHTSELLNLAQYFEQSADDTTMVPRYMGGDNPTTGAAATMGGLSMLLGQGKLSIKSLAVNFDEGITRPALTALVGWNMLYHPDADIKGDFVVLARGASSLVAKEVRAAQAAQFGASLRPEEARFVKWKKLLDAKAEANEFQDVVMSDQEAKAVEDDPTAKQLQQLQAQSIQLDIATKAAKLQQIKTETLEIEMSALLKKSQAMETTIQALYESLQGAGIAVQNPAISIAADHIARQAGFTSAEQPAPVQQSPQPAQQAPQQHPVSPAAPSAMPAPIPSAAPRVPDAGQGVAAGIETPAVGAGQ